MLKNYLFLFIFACLLTLSGCFGATFQNDIGYEIYFPAGTTPKILAGGTEYQLNTGDIIEITNNDPSTYSGSPLNFPTCLYSFFVYNGVLVRAGYDPGATLQGGQEKYSSAYQGILGSGSQYSVDIMRNGIKIHHFELPYGEAGGIFSNTFSKIKLITATNSTNLININSYVSTLGDNSTRGTALDRTVCFAASTDPVTFAVAELPAPPSPTDPTQPPPPEPAPPPPAPSDLDNLNAGQGDLVPVPQQELDKVTQGSTLPQGPSQVTTTAQTSEGKGGGGGGCMQLDPNSNAPSTAWIWVTTLCVTGMVLARRKLLAHR